MLTNRVDSGFFCLKIFPFLLLLPTILTLTLRQNSSLKCPSFTPPPPHSPHYCFIYIPFLTPHPIVPVQFEWQKTQEKPKPWYLKMTHKAGLKGVFGVYGGKCNRNILGGNFPMEGSGIAVTIVFCF